MPENEKIQTWDPSKDPDTILSDAPPHVRFGYVITQAGRAWSEEGLLQATDEINERWPAPENAPPHSGILWSAGYLLNDPLLLAGLLRKRPESFIVLSMDEGYCILENDLGGGGTVAELLETDPDAETRTTWEILYAIWQGAGT